MIAHLVARTVSAVVAAPMAACARHTFDETVVERDSCRTPGYRHAWNLAGLQGPQ